MIIGLDVGGTHTDAVLLNNDGILRECKVPTDSSDLFHTVLTGLDKITSGIDPQEINRLVLSTTLTTNAIVQNKIPRVGMIVTGGPGIDPLLFKTNDCYHVVSGCIDHRGREIEQVDPEQVEKIGEAFRREGIAQIGVVGKFSIRNPTHELQIAGLLGGIAEKIFMGHQVSGSLNFPRRIATTYLNAAVYPLHKRFFKAVSKSLETKGLFLPIRILKADGGNMSFESSIDSPGETILSGPAASIMGSIAFAPERGDCLVLDIGGTTTDMAVLVNGAPLLDPVGIEIGGYKTLIRSLDTLSIGIGGDSLVRAEGGELRIGPHRLGPAMAYGGPAPTPTDALFVLGKMSDGEREKSIEGIGRIAGELGIPLEEAAFRIFDAACRRIVFEARSMVDRINSKPVYTVHELREGYQVKPETFFVLGGPAPFFAAHFATHFGLKVRVVPKWKVANAIGAALARTTCDVILFADTEQGIASAPEENFQKKIGKGFDGKEAVKEAFELLRKKALLRGANPKHLEMEAVEVLEFNMVRGFYTTGKNIRVRVQVKPGLIQGFDPALERLLEDFKAMPLPETGR